MVDISSASLTVVGAGPAGIMAAATAAEHGVDVLVVDDHGMSSMDVLCDFCAIFS